jgi:hypothetical protein
MQHTPDHAGRPQWPAGHICIIDADGPTFVYVYAGLPRSAGDRLTEALAHLVELEHREFVRGRWLGRDKLVERPLGLVAGVELAD